MIPATPTKLRSGNWGARVTGPVKVGDKLRITTKGGKSWDAEVTSVVWTDGSVSICATASLDAAPKPTAKRAPTAQRAPRLPELVGERSELSSDFEGTKADRAPHRALGEACYLQHRGSRIAAVVVGYEPARYLDSETAEDMGHYGVQSGYHGVIFYRLATEAEAQALAASPAEVAKRERAERLEQRSIASKTLGAALRWDAADVIATPEIEIKGRPSTDGAELAVKLDGGREWYFLTESSIVRWHGGYPDDYRQSLCTLPRSAPSADAAITALRLLAS